MELYHVSQADAVPSIKRQGLRTSPPKGKWTDTRTQMRRLLDELGNTQRANWVNRENAVFFWPTYDAARLYSGRNPLPVLVEVDGSNLDAWVVKNEYIEDLYNHIARQVYDGTIRATEAGEHDEIREKAERIVQSAKPWNGETDDGLEVWAQPPVPASAVMDIYNYDKTSIE